MKQWIQPREAPNRVTTGVGGAQSGDAAMFGPATRKVFGIIQAKADPNSEAAVQSEGVVELDKVSAAVFVFGQEVFWDDTAKNVGVSATGKWPIGYCVTPGGAGSGILKCRVKLIGSNVTAV